MTECILPAGTLLGALGGVVFDPDRWTAFESQPGVHTARATAGALQFPVATVAGDRSICLM